MQLKQYFRKIYGLKVLSYERKTFQNLWTEYLLYEVIKIISNKSKKVEGKYDVKN